MATITIKPISDISLQHSCSSGSNGYSLLADNSDSTYIVDRNDGTKSSTFRLSGTNVLPAHEKIVSVTVYFRGQMANTNKTTNTSTVTVKAGSSVSSAIQLAYLAWGTHSFALNVSDLTISGADCSVDVTLETYTQARQGKAVYTEVSQLYIEIVTEPYIPVTITSSVTGRATINPSGSVVLYPYDTYFLTITPTSMSSFIEVTKNGTDITSQLVQHETYYAYEYTLSESDRTIDITVNVIEHVHNGYVKINGEWIVAMSYQKINGRWEILYEGEQPQGWTENNRVKEK